MMAKLWGGRFTGENRSAHFTASIGTDQRLYREDIKGSIAHAEMLAHQGIISAEEGRHIVDGLRIIEAKIASGAVELTEEHEDIHMNIEALLIEEIGTAGEKLHTGRSRNDQVATDMHLYMKTAIGTVLKRLRDLQDAVVELAERHSMVMMPGYTHLQRAQPVLFSHHLLAYFFMLKRDEERLIAARERTDQCPLGAGALAGSSLPLDRVMVAEDLGFTSLYANSMDAVSDRDYLIEFASASALIMMHLSRLAEELILWSSHEFGFVELDDAYATGSSIMPQKKNPDTMELVRGKTGRVYGNLTTLLTMMKSLPLAYHSDMQEDKEAVFDTLDTVTACLAITAEVINTLHVHPKRMASGLNDDFSLATDVADYLVAQGVPFRRAHRIVGEVVRYCLAGGLSLSELTLDTWQAFSPAFSEDIVNGVDAASSIAGRKTPGGAGGESVKAQIEEARRHLASPY